MNTQKILDVKVDFDMTYDDVLKKIENEMLHKNISSYICTTNPEFIMAAQKDEEFKKIINSSSISTPDGYGVLLARKFINKYKSNITSVCLLKKIKAWFMGTYIGLQSLLISDKKDERITGVELTKKICELASKKGYTVFLLGGWPKDKWGKMLPIKEDFAQVTSDELKKLYPGLKVVGATSQFSWKQSDDIKTLNYIKKKMIENNVDSIDFLFVAYNHGNQEKWIVRNSHKVPVKVSIGVGGTFDYISGHYKQTPGFFERNHLAWLFRLVTQPHRIKRIWNAFPVFPIKVFLDTVTK
jgi:N-acetylglucosaminyldiphosphoundecaprenol N-acetyl-beta-D-mannosaminyltransferase